MRFANILFPADRSDRCRRAVPHVRQAVEQFQAKLTLLHVIEYPALSLYGDGVYIPENLLPDLKSAAEDIMADFAQVHFSDLKPKIVVEQGDAGIRIVDRANEDKADLIMIPTHGRGRFRSALLGSVTSKVLHDAACPVWTDAHTLEEPDSQHSSWRSIVCALNTGSHAAELIRFARDLGETCAAEVRLVHAVPAPERGIAERSIESADLEFTDFLKESARTSINAMQEEEGTEFPLCVNAGPVSKVVADAAQRYRADLVLIGRGSIANFAGRLRTHEYSIIRDAPCPVLSI